MIKQLKFCLLTIFAGTIATAASLAISLGEESSGDTMICSQFEASAAQINASDLAARYDMFSSFRVVVDCLKDEYLYHFEIDQSKLPNFLRDEQYIKTSFSEAICRNIALWEPAFANGWSASFMFIGPNREILAYMRVDSCDAKGA
jgi:hypothetical protein